jgi:hypothetical protein
MVGSLGGGGKETPAAQTIEGKFFSEDHLLLAMHSRELVVEHLLLAASAVHRRI